MKLSIIYLFLIQNVLCKKGKLILDETFNYLDFSLWEHEISLTGGGNYEFQYYLNNRTNSYIENGILNIYPSFTKDILGLNNTIGNIDNPFLFDIWGECNNPQFYGCQRISNGNHIINPITSAKITTKNSFWFKYGHLEFKAKLPKGDWLWPAIWLLPKYEIYGNWPASGEIDILESRGNDINYPKGGINSFSSTLHWGPIQELDKYNKTTDIFKLNNNNFNDDFHIFGLKWDKTKIETYIDEETNIILSHSFKDKLWNYGNFDIFNIYNPWKYGNINAPFDQEFYIIINLAVGGLNDYFPDNIGNKPWNMNDDNGALKFWNNYHKWYPTWLPEENRKFQIDYIKVWEYEDTTYSSIYKINEYDKSNNYVLLYILLINILLIIIVYFIFIKKHKSHYNIHTVNYNSINNNINEKTPLTKRAYLRV